MDMAFSALWCVLALAFVIIGILGVIRRRTTGLDNAGVRNADENSVRPNKFIVGDGGHKTEVPMDEVDKYSKEHGCSKGIAMVALAAQRGMERRNQCRLVPKEMDLPYLERDAGFNDSIVKQLHDFVSKDGNFRLKLPEDIMHEPIIKVMSPTLRQFHFNGVDRLKWVHVEYMTNARGGADIREWVEMPVMMFGRPMLGTESRFEVVKFDWVPAISTSYLKRHGADEMATFIGTIMIEGALCRVFMVCLRRGNEAWRVEYAFPASVTENTTEGRVVYQRLRKPNSINEVPEHPSHTEMKKAANVLGWFRAYDAVKCRFCGRTVSDEEVLKVELENVQCDFLPVRADATVSVPCCLDCLRQQDEHGMDLERIKKDEMVCELLSRGAHIKQSWMQGLCRKENG